MSAPKPAPKSASVSIAGLNRRSRVLTFALTLLLLLGGVAWPPAAQAGGGPDGAKPVASAPADVRALQPVQEAYALLLQRYAVPLDSAALAEAAQSGMVAALDAAGLPDPGPGLVVFGDAPDQQWVGLRQRFLALAARYGDVVAPSALEYAAIQGMAELTDDAHTNFITPEQFAEHQRWELGDVSYAGIGARMRGPQPTIVEVFPDTPAEHAGLRPGDVIVAVDGQSTADRRLDEVIDLVRGPEGSSVTLGVQRAGTDQMDELTVARAKVATPFVTSRRLPGNLGYVQLRGFPEPSVVDGVVQAILEHQRNGVSGIVLDLRGNGGGRLDVGSRLLSRFIPDGPIYQAVDRQGNKETVNVQGARPILTVPLAVLIDEGTASMGEVFAAAIQEHGVGRVIGSTTAGAVAASVFRPLSDGSALQLSVELVYSGGGALLDKVGVHPDDEVPLDLDALRQGHDVQLEHATGYLQQQAAEPALTAAGG